MPKRTNEARRQSGGNTHKHGATELYARPGPPEPDADEPEDPLAPRMRESLGEYLERLHASYGYRRQDVARRVPIARTTYSAITNDLKGASEETLIGLANVFELPKSYFLRFRDRYKHTPVPLRTLLRDRQLLQKFLDCDVDEATFDWAVRTLTIIADQLDKWDVYHQKKKLAEERRKAQERQAAADAIETQKIIDEMNREALEGLKRKEQ